MKYLPHVISEIFDFKNYRDLETGVVGHSSSSKMVPLNSLGTVSYTCSIVTLCLRRTVSQIFDFENCRDLEIQGRGRSMSLKMTPFDRPHIVSY